MSSKHELKNNDWLLPVLYFLSLVSLLLLGERPEEAEGTSWAHENRGKSENLGHVSWSPLLPALGKEWPQGSSVEFQSRKGSCPLKELGMVNV